MKTMEEIRNEWHDIRQKLGNLICAIDGKEASLKSLDEAYERGLADGTKCTQNRCLECGEYKRGLDDAWSAARKIENMTFGEIIKVFFDEDYTKDASFVCNRFSVDEALDKLKAYKNKKEDFCIGDEIMYKDGSIGIITAISNGWCYILWSNGTSGTFLVEDLKIDFKKAGRNYASFEGLLLAMKHRDG